MSKSAKLKAFDGATKTKLDILEKYLEAWVAIFYRKPARPKANIIDAYCGSGQDDLGVRGSALRILDVLISSEEFKKRSRLSNLTVYLNDQSKSKIKALEKLISTNKIYDSLNIKISCKDGDSFLTETLQTRQKDFNLVFIDPYGIGGVSLLDFLSKLHYTDFLIFITSGYIKRFKDTPEFKNKLSGYDLDNLSVTDKYDVHNTLCELLREKVSHTETRLYPFTLVKSHGPKNVYGLIFGTHNIRGVDKFLEVAWTIDPDSGSANRDIDARKQQTNLFDTTQGETKTDRFHKDLKQFIINSKQVNNKQIYEFTLKKGFRPTHANQFIKSLIKNKEIKSSHPRALRLNYEDIYNLKKEPIIFKVVQT